MFKKFMLIVTAFALVLAFGAANAFAEDEAKDPACPGVYNEDEETWVYAYYCDGRLNAFDMMQSVAIYYDHTAEPTWNLVTTEDEDGEEVQVWEEQMTEVVSAIHIWAIDADGNGQLALYVPVAQIEAAFSATAPVQIASANGIALNYTPASHTFTVTAPDGYSFTWDAW